MLTLTCDITIGAYRFNAVNEVAIKSSWTTLTDTCEITFPRKSNWEGVKLQDLIRRGDRVKVSLGYNGREELVFDGFVVDLSAKVPVRVICQDYAFLLKKGNLNISLRDGSLKKVLDEIKGVVDFEIRENISVELGPYRVSNMTPAKILEDLRSKFFVKSWFRSGVMHCGLAYVAELQRGHVIRFDRNVIEHDLDFRRREDVSMRLKAIIVSPDNKRNEVEIGDPDGEQRTFHYYNVSESVAKERLEAEIDRLKYTGYRGTFTTFGEPQINHGDVVEIIDGEYPERDGRYLVRSVDIKFGVGGYRQVVELEEKVV